jgi:hypothetical protein
MREFIGNRLVLFAETGCPWQARRLHGSEGGLRIAPAGVQRPDGLLSSLSFSIHKRKRPVSGAAAHGARRRRSIANLYITAFCAQECFHLAQDTLSCQPDIANSAPE